MKEIQGRQHATIGTTLEPVRMETGASFRTMQKLGTKGQHMIVKVDEEESETQEDKLLSISLITCGLIHVVESQECTRLVGR